MLPAPAGTVRSANGALVPRHRPSKKTRILRQYPGIESLADQEFSHVHVLQIVSGREVNGAVTYANFLTRRLIADGYQVSVLHRDNPWLDSQKIPGVNYLHSELCRTPSELKRIANWCSDHHVDLMHTHMSRAHFFGVLLKTLTGRPVVATAHSCTFQLHWMLNNYVIANSMSTLRYQRRINRVRANKSSMVYCFTELERFRHVDAETIAATRQSLNATDHDFLIGVVGQVGPRKGQKLLFDSLPELFQRIPNLKVVLLGQYKKEDAYVKRLRARQLRNDWAGRIKWLGQRDNVQDYMNAMDLCVVPSLREPLGLVALEALASGTPVVATRTGGLPELVTQDETGLLVSPGNVPELTDAIINMSQSPDRRKRMGIRGRQMVIDKFQPDLLTRQVTDIYDRIVGSCVTSTAN